MHIYVGISYQPNMFQFHTARPHLANCSAVQTAEPFLCLMQRAFSLWHCIVVWLFSKLY